MHTITRSLRIVEQRLNLLEHETAQLFTVLKKENVLFHFLISVNLFHVEHRSSFLRRRLNRIRLILGRLWTKALSVWHKYIMSNILYGHIRRQTLGLPDGKPHEYDYRQTRMKTDGTELRQPRRSLRNFRIFKQNCARRLPVMRLGWNPKSSECG
jgi:hypothetical protein